MKFTTGGCARRQRNPQWAAAKEALVEQIPVAWCPCSAPICDQSV
ncbi:hypothetical protein LJR066_002987 [Acidovorax sp. LjRoot66]|nr:hypothetical protein [Acidovorax sp. Root219]